MKNILFIDVDTEKESPLTLGKPEDFPKPTNDEEAKIMILNDHFRRVCRHFTILLPWPQCEW